MEDLEQKEEFYKIQNILCERDDSGIGVSINTEGLSQEGVTRWILPKPSLMPLKMKTRTHGTRLSAATKTVLQRAYGIMKPMPRK
jgi:hypothetical protein